MHAQKISYADKRQFLWKKRALALMKYGFDSYPEYIKSNIWHQSRRRLLKTIKDNSCYCCGKPGSLWHHISYQNLGKELLYKDVVWVCEECHKEIHATPYLNLVKATNAIRRHKQPNLRPWNLGNRKAERARERAGLTFAEYLKINEPKLFRKYCRGNYRYAGYRP